MNGKRRNYVSISNINEKRAPCRVPILTCNPSLNFLPHPENDQIAIRFESEIRTNAIKKQGTRINSDNNNSWKLQ